MDYPGLIRDQIRVSPISSSIPIHSHARSKMNDEITHTGCPRAGYQVALEIVSGARATFPARCGICATCMTLELTLSLSLPSSSSPRRVSIAGMEREKSDRGHETEREERTERGLEGFVLINITSHALPG